MEFPGLTLQLLIEPEFRSMTRSDARAGRGSRYQDAVTAWLASVVWRTHLEATIPEDVDDLTLLEQSASGGLLLLRKTVTYT